VLVIYLVEALVPGSALGLEKATRDSRAATVIAATKDLKFPGTLKPKPVKLK
jgi:hypothetical protein